METLTKFALYPTTTRMETVTPNVVTLVLTRSLPYSHHNIRLVQNFLISRFPVLQDACSRTSASANFLSISCVGYALTIIAVPHSQFSSISNQGHINNKKICSFVHFESAFQAHSMHSAKRRLESVRYSTILSISLFGQRIDLKSKCIWAGLTTNRRKSLYRLKICLWTGYYRRAF